MVQLGSESDPAKRLRSEWSDSLREHLRIAQVSRKELVRRLTEHGCSVSYQAVGQWLRGETSPRPHHQAALAAILRVPVRRLFPIEPATPEAVA